jgi:ribonuclease III
MSVVPVDEHVTDALASLEVAVGHRFGDRGLLQRALSHRSYCAEHPGIESNERLELLGDSVLGLVVTRFIYNRYEDLPEGELAKVRAAVVNATTLAEVSADIGLGDALLVGRGEERSGGRTKESILADAMEAVIAAVYLDAGWTSAEALVLRLLCDRIDEEAVGPGGGDYKTRLQELAARRFDQVPRYRVRDEGPDHKKWFHAVVLLGGDEWGSGDGRSKKHAEQAAARAAWYALAGDGDQVEGTHAGAS